MTHNAKVFEMRARISNTLALWVIETIHILVCINFAFILYPCNWFENFSYGKSWVLDFFWHPAFYQAISIRLIHESRHSSRVSNDIVIYESMAACHTNMLWRQVLVEGIIASLSIITLSPSCFIPYFRVSPQPTNPPSKSFQKNCFLVFSAALGPLSCSHWPGSTGVGGESPKTSRYGRTVTKHCWWMDVEKQESFL